MKNIKEIMVSLMAIAACALPSYGSAEGVTNQISNCVNAHGEEMAADGIELSRNNEAPEVEGGVVGPEFENEGEDADVVLGESGNEASRLFYLATTVRPDQGVRLATCRNWMLSFCVKIASSHV